jgi:hypothetical protein
MTSQIKIKILHIIKKKVPLKEKFLELPVPPNIIVPPKTSSLGEDQEVIIDINENDLDTFIV